MLEGIAEILISVLDLFWLGSNSKKRRHSKINRVVEDWSKKVGLHPQYEYKDDKVRSMKVVDDAGNDYQIWIETLKWRRLKVWVSNNKSGKKNKKWKRTGRDSNLTKVLFEAYGVVEQWILKSGNTRTIY
ncbi:hypothetical protein LV716_13805 [Flagellimonas sp. HMM57]|uniref:hypothetical protein n=1 Tax=unclassified Flagellimonas TaxID=2644544 RepID=UPI0013D8510F|nr:MULTISPECIES: hypothetical protein [unclassified Flagellimonas]UII75322.1 hypothetical protein LV716_13805 [Flagellimonas sp. HMM57]